MLRINLPLGGSKQTVGANYEFISGFIVNLEIPKLSILWKYQSFHSMESFGTSRFTIKPEMNS